MPKHIMVFNDTQEILELFQEILTGEGYSVSLHSYSTRDLDDVKQTRPALIISDHPPFREQEGWQFIQKLKMSRDTDSIPVIICSTNTKWLRDNVDEGYLATKGIVIVPKPFNVDELVRQVTGLIGDAESPKRGALIEGTLRQGVGTDQSEAD